MRHVTPTELALYYDGRLNKEDTDWLQDHLQTCDACGEQYEMVKRQLDDLRAGRVRRLWPWQFNRLWKLVMEAQKEMEAATEGSEQVAIIETEAGRADESEPAPASERVVPVYATTAPGHIATEKAKAAVYDKDGRFDAEVRADHHVDVDERGAISASVRVLESIEELDGKTVWIELANDLDRITLGPAKLVAGKDQYGNVLEARFVREADPEGGLDRTQLQQMSCSVKIRK